ncbi:hypothetical protein PR202_ga18670 [Eleusine coracana subsp. coracana]|uniref:Non-haem dioxygenase N-terminal domain-containing protein n=1 Tax=Eleusine coracana subsp. coracana TaxID=191504 RepID=A0AAV5CUF6_ELECO|nr:hypothetical protein PR202_ga18670 [Eleusine coracana subsp. coracana]
MPACSLLPRYMATTQPQRLPPRAALLPVINLGRLGKDDPASLALVVQDNARACRDRGCFQVINHGVSKSVMKGALEAASAFFELPVEHKEEFASDDIRQPIRYDRSSRDGISLARSFLKHYANPLEDWIDCWPANPPTDR